ncbi:major facilitator superfamily domain-containing protein [Coprinopsis sp. MPI-PUGE-AT-0042]|nr:major facilitator superfamily domain-containing protein [Coprinopsis sp. MPI-PUGE-AT-0042]
MSTALNGETSSKEHVSDGNIPWADDQVLATSPDSKSLSEKVEDEVPATAPFERTPDQIRTGRLQFFALCWCLFICGWNDGTTGPLLPRIREVYNIGFTVVSMVFVTSCIGFILGALMNMWIGPRFGFGKTIALGAFLQILTYSVQIPAPPFPAFVVMNLFNGIGIALQDAQANGFVGSLSSNPEAKMGVLHAAYGLGAFASPLVATQFATMPRWSFHFLVSLGLAVSNSLFVIYVFRLKDQETCLRKAGEPVAGHANGHDDQNSFKQIMTTKAVHFLAFFILVYVGVEVTIGGWIVTFIIEERGGGPSSGYISAGFFGGLTLGRVVLLWVNEKVGERRVVYLYAALALGLEFVVWFVPNLVGDAVAVALIGLFLGPLYPLAMNHTSRILPRWLLTSSIGWIAGFGQAGSALIPFMTGAIAQKHGIRSLHPLLVAMMATMVALWFLIPNVPTTGTPVTPSDAELVTSTAEEKGEARDPQ